MARTSTDTRDRVWVRMPGTYNGVDCDRGQILAHPEGPKSEQLTRLAYLVRYESSAEPHTCPECGAQFSEAVWRTGHYEKRHREKANPMPRRGGDETDQQYSDRVLLWKEQQDDVEARRMEREIAQMPPDTEKSLASMRN